MSTNSYIAIKNNDETIDYIYCHWDGYIENNGVILQLYYNNENRIRKLINLGDISSLEKKLNPIPEKPHEKLNRQENVTLAYARDCDENLRIRYSKNIDDFISDCKGSTAEFVYLYDNNKWYFSTYNDYEIFKSLDKAVIYALFNDYAICMEHFIYMPLEFQLNFIGATNKEDYIKLSKEDKKQEIAIAVKQMPIKVFYDLLHSLINRDYRKCRSKKSKKSNIINKI